MQTIVNFSFAGKRAFVKLTLITFHWTASTYDDTRMRAALPTLKKILHGGWW